MTRPSETPSQHDLADTLDGVLNVACESRRLQEVRIGLLRR